MTSKPIILHKKELEELVKEKFGEHAEVKLHINYNDEGISFYDEIEAVVSFPDSTVTTDAIHVYLSNQN